MDNINYSNLNEMIKYIEENLENDINELARIGGFLQIHYKEYSLL